MSKLYDQLKNAAKLRGEAAHPADPPFATVTLLETAIARARTEREAAAAAPPPSETPPPGGPEALLALQEAAQSRERSERALQATAQDRANAERELELAATQRNAAEEAEGRARADRVEAEEQLARAAWQRAAAEAAAARNAAEWAERAAIAERSRADAEEWAASHARDRAASETRRAAAEKAKSEAARRSLDATRALMRAAEHSHSMHAAAESARASRLGSDAERRKLRVPPTWQRVALPIACFALGGVGMTAIDAYRVNPQPQRAAVVPPATGGAAREAIGPLRLDASLDLTRTDGAARSSPPDRAPSK